MVSHTVGVHFRDTKWRAKNFFHRRRSDSRWKWILTNTNRERSTLIYCDGYRIRSNRRFLSKIPNNILHESITFDLISFLCRMFFGLRLLFVWQRPPSHNEGSWFWMWRAQKLLNKKLDISAFKHSWFFIQPRTNECLLKHCICVTRHREAIANFFKS